MTTTTPRTSTSPLGSRTPVDDIEHDVPAQRPAIALPVGTVQIVNQKISFTLQDTLFGRADVLCEVIAGCDLPAEQRGIHMSRIEQAFDVQAEEEALTLPAIALLIAERIAHTQARPAAHVHLSGDLIVRNHTAVTGLTSLDRITLTAKAVIGPRPTLSLGLSATNMTACPCMQAYALDDLLTHFTGPDSAQDADAVRAGPQAVRAAVRAAVPVATHSQKGRVSVTVEVPFASAPSIQASHPASWVGPAAGQLPQVTDVYRILQAGSTLTSELLKRPDEYDMVKRAHQRAQFVEDVARETAVAAVEHLRAVRSDAVVSVHASSCESIHGHDIEALLSSSLADLRIHQPGRRSA